MKKLLDLTLKDLRRAFGNIFGLVMMLAAPFLITGLIYFAFGGVGGDDGSFNLQPIQAQIVNLDEGIPGFNAGEQLSEFLISDSVAKIVEASRVDSESAARRAVDEQQSDVAVLIPSDFTAGAVSNQAEASVTLYQDPTLTLAPQIMRDLISQFTDGFAGAKIATDVVRAQFNGRGVTLTQDDDQAIANRYAQDLQSGNHHHDTQTASGIKVVPPGSNAEDEQGGVYIGPVMAGMMIFFVFFMGANGAQSIIAEDEEGTLQRLFTTPTPRGTILGGKLFAVIVILIFQTTILLVASSLLFNIRWGEPLAVVLASFSMILAAAGFGVLIMSFLRSTRQTGPVLGGVLTVTGMLGGLFTTGIPDVPAFFDQAKLAMPQGWALEVWQRVLSGASLEMIWMPLSVLTVIGITFFSIGTLIFRRRFA
ncbi:MAG: ABC transporter permease [Anaerolineales bacterium]|jgi:ABC-2 type transport system permease protein